MKIITKAILFTMVLGVSACFDDPGTDIVVGNGSFLELDRAGQPNPVASLTYTKAVDGNPIRYKIQVNIMGPPVESATNVNYAIDPLSTAIAGTHYNLVSTAGTISIAAGESVGFIEIDILDDAWTPVGATGVKDLIVSITGGDLALSKYVKATYRIRIN